MWWKRQRGPAGLDIHFIHVRSKHENALPVIVTHGWPGSILKQLKLIEPLTNPTAHGGTAAAGFQMGLRPQTLYGIADSTVGLAAYFLDHDARSLELIARVFNGESEGLTRDDVLDNVTIAWLTNTGVSGGVSIGRTRGRRSSASRASASRLP
jgi:hypothetical protein